MSRMVLYAGPFLYELMALWGDKRNLSTWDPRNTCDKMVGLACDANGMIVKL